MDLILELIQFIVYSILIVIIVKKFLIKALRTLAEALNLEAKTVGDISGLATSIPELISVFFTSLQGMFAASIFNILSSNIINLIQYIISVYRNKNQQLLENNALKLDIIMVLITILLPLFTIILNMELNISIVPIFLLLLILFYIINRNTHRLYLNDVNIEITKKINEEKRWIKGKKKVVIKNIIYIIIIGITLFIIGEMLGNVIESLAVVFNVSQAIIGITLGFITSIPELITFIEAQKHHKKEESNLSGVVEATNNLLTSNMINLFVVLTIGIFVTSMV